MQKNGTRARHRPRHRLGRRRRRRPSRLLTYRLSGTITDACGQAGAGRRRDHAHAGPRLLDALVRDRRERPLHVVLRGLRRDGADPGDPRPSASRSATSSYGGTLGTNAPFARLKSATLNIQLGCGDELHDHEADARTPARSTPASSSASPPAATWSSRSPRRWPDAKGELLDDASRVGARQDAALLGEPAAVLLALPGQRRAARSTSRRGRRSSERRTPTGLAVLRVSG